MCLCPQRTISRAARRWGLNSQDKHQATTMKLRIKLTDNPQATHKVEVPGTTLGDLQAILVASITQLQSLDATAVRISLNKKTVLSEDATARLSHLGICSGDTLWVLRGNTAGDPTGPTAAPAAAAPAPQLRSSPLTTTTTTTTMTCLAGPSTATASAPTAAPTTIPTKRLRPEGEAAQQRAALAGTAGGGGSAAGTSGSQAMEVDPPVPHGGAQGSQAAAVQGSGGGHDHMDDHMGDHMDEDVAPEQGGVVVPQAPAHLLRTLTAWAATSNTTPDQDQATAAPPQPTAAHHAAHQLLLLAAHAALAEQCFQLAPSTAVAPTNQPPGQPPVHAVPVSLQALQMPASGVLSVTYVYRPRDTAVQMDTAGGLGHAAAATIGSSSTTSPTPVPTTSPTPATASATTTASTTPAPATVPAATPSHPVLAPTASCQVKAIALGPHLILHAAVQQPSGVTNVRSLNLDTRVQVEVVKAADALRQAENGREEDSRRWLAGALGAFKALGSLWVTLQDDLVTWAVRASCAALGRDPPGGFMGLPRDLRMDIMGQLPAQALARLTCTCVELRHWGGDNSLWEPVFTREFPSASNSIRNTAAQRGFQAAFGVAWRARQERERARRHMGHMMPPHGPLYPAPLPFNPFMPVPGPYHPGIVGGDYDRFPALPGFPGPGGGMLGNFPGVGPGMGGGPGLGGLMGVPRQAGLPGLLGPRGGPGAPPQAPLFGSGRARGAAGGVHGPWG